jgi:hypothetical protein
LTSARSPLQSRAVHALERRHLAYSWSLSLSGG